MKTKKILWYVAALSMVAAGLSACNKAESGEDGGEQTGNTRFRVSVNDETLTSESVTVSVTCTGGSDTWYCFVTDDMESDIEKAIADELAVITDYQSVLKAGNQSVTFNGLQQRTAYRAIVTGLLTDGTPVGTPDDEEFTTPLPEGTWVVNENWSCTYIERDDMTVDPEQGTTVYGDILTFTVESGVDFYLPAVVSLNDFKEIYNEDINEFAKSEIAKVKDEMAWREDLGELPMWSDYLLDYSMTGTLGILDSDEQWYAVMLGVDLDGKSTGLYVLSEPFTPQEEAASDTYSQWLGTWKITGSNMLSSTGQYASETIRIEADENNYRYLVYDWETATNEDIEFPPFHANFDKLTGNLSFMAEDALQRVNMGDLDIEGGGEQYGNADIGFYGFYLQNQASSQFNSVMGGYVIAIASMSEDGQVTVAEQDVELSDGSVADLVGMWYAADLFEYTPGGQSGYMLNFDYIVPRFPYTMEKVEETAPAVSAASVSASRPSVTGPVKGIRTYSLPRFAK